MKVAGAVDYMPQDLFWLLCEPGQVPYTPLTVKVPDEGKGPAMRREGVKMVTG